MFWRFIAHVLVSCSMFIYFAGYKCHVVIGGDLVDLQILGCKYGSFC